MSKRVLIIIILLTVINITKITACNCIPFYLDELQKLSYEDSDLVFVADANLIDRHSGEFRLTIIELFKGNSKSDTLTILPDSSCSLFIESGRWLIYAKVTGEGTIIVDDCGPSRSFLEPHKILVKDYDRYPPFGGNIKSNSDNVDYSLKEAKHELLLREKALSDLEIEIQWLRNK